MEIGYAVHGLHAAVEHLVMYATNQAQAVHKPALVHGQMMMVVVCLTQAPTPEHAQKQEVQLELFVEQLEVQVFVQILMNVENGNE